MLLRAMLVTVGLVLGGGCVIVGIQAYTAERDRSGSGDGPGIEVLGEAYERLLGWMSIVVGALILCIVLAYLAYLLFRRLFGDAKQPGRVAAPPPLPSPLPEARAHVRPPDERNGK